MSRFSRSATVEVKAKLENVFPLLCPKKEEDWIPGWECQTICSKSGYNEEGAVFRTTKPYGTELYWYTIEYDMRNKIVDFLISAPGLFMLRYRISLVQASAGLSITFSQVFTPVSQEGSNFLKRYESEDFQGKLNNLGALINAYLEKRE